ncbi:MAG: 4-hydroxybenzoyl-CoA reductase [candidate division NC10 bacterium RIFCSPLOWO2_02_FULL_66_22]|nr:MAG: 4-hydroxybenzoyl-CoA reductase [candidate division NC10 bacterium RIFCSPLOWO2_02_FULL_66_22]
MMRLPAFRYLAPRSLAEATRMIADAGPDGMLVSGGTDLYPNMKRLQFDPRILVGLRHLPELLGVSGDPQRGMRIGAATSLHQISLHPAIRAHYPSLATAAGSVATPQIQRMGTIGGNLCVDTRCNYYNQSYEWRRAIGFCMKRDGDVCLVAPGSPRCVAVSSSDTAPVMMALGATVVLTGPDGERTVPAAALYRDDGMAYLTRRPEEILTAILLPPVDGLRSTYWKLRRRGSFDFPILGVAASLRLGGDGTCADARIVLGAVSPHPMRAAAAEEVLLGRRLTPELIEEAAMAAYRPAKPLDNTDLTLAYRKRMVRVFVSRALRELANLP